MDPVRAEDLERDLERDYGVCQKITGLPWLTTYMRVRAADGSIVADGKLHGHEGDNMLFIAAASQGWPAALRRLAAAETRADGLQCRLESAERGESTLAGMLDVERRRVKELEAKLAAAEAKAESLQGQVDRLASKVEVLEVYRSVAAPHIVTRSPSPEEAEQLRKAMLESLKTATTADLIPQPRPLAHIELGAEHPKVKEFAARLAAAEKKQAELEEAFKRIEEKAVSEEELKQSDMAWEGCPHDPEGEIVDPGFTVEPEAVNNPHHYAARDGSGMWAIDAIRAMLTPEQYRGYLRGTILAYLWRGPDKNAEEEDYRKAVWYLERLLRQVNEEGK